MRIKYHCLSYPTIFRAQLMTVVHAGVIINSITRRASGTCLRLEQLCVCGHPAWHPFLEPVSSLPSQGFDTFEPSA
jgi:hypothetical protein